MESREKRVAERQYRNNKPYRRATPTSVKGQGLKPTASPNNERSGRFRYDRELRRCVEITEENEPGLRVETVQPKGCTMSVTLPKNYRYHKGEFAKGIKGVPDGTVLFTGPRQIADTLRRAQDAGDGLEYDGKIR